MISADLWELDGIKVVSVNSAGVHGRGLANQAMRKGFIQYGRNRCFYESPLDSDVRCICVKGFAPETARRAGKVWSERVTAGNLTKLKDELTALCIEASMHPWRSYWLPMVGLGFGEGDADVILPLLQKIEREHHNITLVSRSARATETHAQSLRAGVRRDASSRPSTSYKAGRTDNLKPCTKCTMLVDVRAPDMCGDCRRGA